MILRTWVDYPEEVGMQKRVECECGWSLQTDDEAKLVAGVQQHAKQIHNMDGVTKDQVLAQARPV